ncbi:hypothetical protein BU17DRAFT_86604 [Hysterangium stoloniferum]|nr:hypothetical protein BU17DRAFT_86604 [Hysterangium stoloniferum]
MVHSAAAHDPHAINLLDQYIVSTPLVVPTEARNLIFLMLIPDPNGKAGLHEIMAHSVVAGHLYVICSIEPSAGSRRTRWTTEERQTYQCQCTPMLSIPAHKLFSNTSPRFCTLPAATSRPGSIVMNSPATPVPFLNAQRGAILPRSLRLFPTSIPYPCPLHLPPTHVPYIYPLPMSPTSTPYPCPLHLSPTPKVVMEQQEKKDKSVDARRSRAAAQRANSAATPHRPVASGIDIGYSTKPKPFINAPRPDPTLIEPLVDRSPAGFAEEGPYPEDRRHPRKAQ